MLKIYHSCDIKQAVKSESPLTNSCAALILTVDRPDDEDGLITHPILQSPQLPKSEMLKLLPNQISYLDAYQQRDILNLVSEFSCLFGNVPTRTTVLEHDIDVKDAQPIKQHHYRLNQVKRDLIETRISIFVGAWIDKTQF